jgi:hypothetical protein
MLKKLKRCDVLFEFFTSDRTVVPHLRTYLRSEAQPDEEKIVRYLANATALLISPGVQFDVIDSSKVAGSQDVLTDGVWVWPAPAAYYVDTYHVTLPDDFVGHMRRNQWIAPLVPESQLIALFQIIEPEDRII